VREIRSLDILSVKKSAKQSAREMPERAIVVSSDIALDDRELL